MSGSNSDPTRFLPEPELSLSDIAGHALGGRPDEGQCEVVDGAGAVHAHVGDEPSLHQVNHEARQALLDDVGAHHQDDRSSGSMCLCHTLGDLSQAGGVERQHVGEGFKSEATAVEERIGHADLLTFSSGSGQASIRRFATLRTPVLSLTKGLACLNQPNCRKQA